MTSSFGLKSSGLRKRANATEIIPAPIVVPPSEYLYVSSRQLRTPSKRMLTSFEVKALMASGALLTFVLAHLLKVYE